MICMNPVKEGEESIKKRTVSKTKAITEEGERKVVKYFNIEQKWECLLEEWEDQNKTVTGFKQYFELLFLAI